MIDKNLLFDLAEEYLGCNRKDVLSKKRTQPVVDARHVLIWVCKKVSSLTTTEIGRIFERHHATVLYAIKSIEEIPEGSNLEYLKIKARQIAMLYMNRVRNDSENSIQRERERDTVALHDG